MAEKPYRVQLRRKKGWRMPPNTVNVSRPCKWGNIYKTRQLAIARALRIAKKSIDSDLQN